MNNSLFPNLSRRIFLWLFLITGSGIPLAADPLLHQHIPLDSDTPWLLMHCLLAYGPQAKVMQSDSQECNILDFLVRKAQYRNRPFIYNDPIKGLSIQYRDEATARFTVEAHQDQFLGYLSLTGYSLEDSPPSETLTRLRQLIRNSVRQFSLDRDYAFSLPMYIHFHSEITQSFSESNYHNRIAQLVSRLLNGGLDDVICEGSHRNIALAAFTLDSKLQKQFPQLREPVRVFLQNQALAIFSQYQKRNDLTTISNKEELIQDLLVLGHNLEWMFQMETYMQWNHADLQMLHSRLLLVSQNYNEFFGSLGDYLHAVHSFHFSRFTNPPSMATSMGQSQTERR